jgi:circadian clock protein KaiC
MDNERMSSGIQNLDELIEGGFPEGSIIMVEGDAGTGKTTFSMHYLLAGDSKDDKGIYVTIDESRKSIIKNMSRYNMDLESAEQRGSIYFHECNPHQFRTDLDKGIIGVEDKIRDTQMKRLVIDNITALALLYDSEAKQRSAVRMLFERIKTWGLTTLIITESGTDGNDFGLKYLVDGWIRLYNKKIRQERVRSIEVMKMRGTNHDKKETIYRIERDGINLYPNEKLLD